MRATLNKIFSTQHCLYALLLVLVTCPIFISCTNNNNTINLKDLEKTLFQRDHLPLILVEGLTILEKHYDFSPCLPLTMNADGCLSSQPKCKLPALYISPVISFPMSASFQVCPHNRTLTSVLYIPDTVIETQPIQFNMVYDSFHKTATVSADLRVKVSGRNALRLLFGSFKLNASFSVKIRLRHWPQLHYKVKLDYEVRQKKIFASKYNCVACQQKWSRHGTWSVSSLLQILADATGN